MTKVDAIVLAGAPNKGPLQEVDAAKWEAAIPIHDKMMVSYVVEALQDSEYIAKTVVVGPTEIKGALPPGVTFVQSGNSLTENIFLAMDHLEKQNNVLMVTCDIPLVHAEAIDDFLERCAELPGDVYYPLISKEANQQAYPGSQRTYFTLKEGCFTGGNVLLASPQAILNSRWVMDDVISQRKKPWMLVRMLGFMFIIKFLTKRLSMGELEKRASSILGYKGVFIITPYPELGTDVDKPSDLELVRKVLAPVQGKEA
ncbi:MAG TPA: NTP transferase domain-containing protein [Firmicutes bacterium]|nr:NTP transferase domain-containing protein [Bacillota bacterium]